MRPLLAALCFVAACAPDAPPSRSVAAPAAVAPAPEGVAAPPEGAAPLPAPLPASPTEVAPAEPAQAEAEPPEPGPELPADPYLAPDAATRFPRRALVGQGLGLRFTLQVNPTTRPHADSSGYVSPRIPHGPLEAVVVEERPKSVRVVMTDAYLRLVAYAPLPVLRWVSVTSTWLSTAAERAPESGGGRARGAGGLALRESSGWDR